MPGDVALWPNLSGGEVIDLLIKMRGATIDQSRRSELLERFELDPTKRGRAYSKGNRQKVALVAAFASPASVLILDEPTSGLDPLMEHESNACLAESTRAGTTVLLSSHILGEVERLADRVTIIRDGRTVESGTLADLRHLRRNRATAELSDPRPDLACLRGVRDVVISGRTITCLVDPDGVPSVLAALAAAGVQSMTSAPPTLEELFMDVYRHRPSGGVQVSTDASAGTRLRGTARLARLAARRDRVMIPAWLAVLVLVSGATRREVKPSSWAERR